MSYMEHKRISARSRGHQDFFLHFSAIKGIARAASINKAGISGIASPLNTLGSYRVTEIPAAVAAGILKEWERLFAEAHAEDDVTFGDKLAAIRVGEWNSLTGLGYEVKELDVERLATQSGCETIDKRADVVARIDQGTSCCEIAAGQRPTA